MNDTPPSPKRKRLRNPLRLSARGLVIVFAAMLAAALVMRLTGFGSLAPIGSTVQNVSEDIVVTPTEFFREDILRIATDNGLPGGIKPHSLERRSTAEGVVLWEVRQYATESSGRIVTIDGGTGQVLSETNWNTAEN